MIAVLPPSTQPIDWPGFREDGPAFRVMGREAVLTVTDHATSCEVEVTQGWDASQSRTSRRR